MTTVLSNLPFKGCFQMCGKILYLLICLFSADLLSVESSPVWQQGKPFTGGSNGEILSVPIKNFPIRSGSVTARFRLNSKLIPEKQTATIFDFISTPEYYDRLMLRLVPDRTGKYILEFTACETNKGRYAGYHVTYPATVTPGEWHTAGISWENVNSGSNNVVLKLYFDGVLVGQLADFELSIKNTAAHFYVGGAHKPFPNGNPRSLSLEKLELWNTALTPAEFHARTEQKMESSSNTAFTLAGKSAGNITADGSFQPGEWEQAVSAGPFVLRRLGTIAPYHTDLRIAYTRHKLYIGWQAKTDGMPVSKSREHDGPLWYEDSMELLLSPDGRKVIHFIGNTKNAVYDELSEDGGKNYRVDWNGKWNYKAGYKDNIWTGELEIDLASNGLPEIKPGDEWRFNAVRNGFSPQAESSWNLSPEGNIRTVERLGIIKFTDSLRSLRVTDFPNLFPGTTMLGLELFSNGNTAKTLDVAFTLHSGKRQWKSARRFPAKESGTQRFTVAIPESGRYTGEIKVTGEDGKEIMLRPFHAEVAQPLVLELESGSPMENMKVAADISRVNLPYSSACLKLLDSKGKLLQRLPLRNSSQTSVISLKNLPEGDYTVAAELAGANGVVLAERRRNFHRYVRPDTISATAGTQTAWRGWTPVARRNADILCWNRSYRLSDTIFPEKMISAGRDLLHGAPEFRYTRNGIHKTLKSATLKVLSESPEKVTLAVNGGNEDVQVSGTIAVEYDGAVIYRLSLEPRHRNIRDFALLLRLNPAEAQMILEGTEHTFRDEKNRIGSRIGWQRRMPFQFKFGIGNGDRSLYWFIESDRNWLPYDRDDAVLVTRRKDCVEVKLQVVSGNHVLAPGVWKCGFIATPIKPVNFDLEGLRVVHAWPGGQYFSSDPADYSRFNIRKAFEYGARVIILHEYWPRYYGGCEPVNPEDLKRFVREAHALGMRVLLYRSHLANEKEPSQAYYNRNWLAYPVVAYVKSESRPYSDGVTRCPEGKDFIDYSIASNEKLLLDYGIDGFYYDIAANPCANGSHGCGYEPEQRGTAASGHTNITIGMDVQENRPNPYAGRRVTWSLLREREFWRRMYNMVHEHRGEKGLVIAHVSWATDAIYCAFSDSVCHSEFSACNWDGQKLPSPDQYRLFFSKQFWGLPGNYLCYQPAQLSLLGMALLHRETYWMKTYGNYSFFKEDNYRMCGKAWKILSDFGVNEAQWHPYYEKAPAVAASGKNVYASYWSKDGKLLAVVANLNDTETMTTLSVPGAVRAVDRWRDNSPLELQNGKCRLRLAAHDFTIVEVELQNTGKQQ